MLSLFGLLGMISTAVALLVLAGLSRRLGKVTRAPRYYIGFYVGAILIAVSIVVRILAILQLVVLATSDPFWVLIVVGLPALSLTVSLIIAWRYWSWLLAERG